MSSSGKGVVTVRCRAVGLKFLSGISSSYDSAYPAELNGHISQSDFERSMEKINEAIAEFWPCTMCYVFGYACAPCSLGASLFCPRVCISRAEQRLINELDQVSMSPKYYDRGIQWSLHKTCCNSWIVIEIPSQKSCV